MLYRKDYLYYRYAMIQFYLFKHICIAKRMSPLNEYNIHFETLQSYDDIEYNAIQF